MCLVLELGISPDTELGISLQPQPLTRFGALTLCIHRHWLSSRLPLAPPCRPAPSTPATPPLPLRRRPSPSHCGGDPLPFHLGGASQKQGGAPSTPAAAPPLPLWRRPLPFHLDGASKKQGDAPFHSGGGAPSTPAAVQVRPSPSSSIWMRSVLPRSR